MSYASEKHDIAFKTKVTQKNLKHVQLSKCGVLRAEI